jgi:hypothetical protein
MPNMTNAPAAAAVFSDETLSKGAELAADAYRPVWIGLSGEVPSGETVARHLEATIALLDKDGWVRAYNYNKDWSTGAARRRRLHDGQADGPGAFAVRSRRERH